MCQWGGTTSPAAIMARDLLAMVSADSGPQVAEPAAGSDPAADGARSSDQPTWRPDRTGSTNLAMRR